MLRFTRKLTKTKRGSTFVLLPTELVKKLGWRDRQMIAVSKKSGAIVLRDAKRKRSR
ncbi:MAG: hypothetical protein WAP74_03350 [Patescibacteria group bacterium]